MIAEYELFRPLFAEAMDGRLYSIGYLDGLVHSGRARFWSSETAAIVAMLERYPTGILVVEGVIAAGELEGIKQLIPLALEWGRDNGATLGLIESREGWAKALKADGWEAHQLALTKEI